MQGFFDHRRRWLLVTVVAFVGACSTYQPLDRGSSVPWAGSKVSPVLAVASAPRTAAFTGGGRRHTVLAGDRLGTVARRYGVEVRALAAANELKPPHVIYVGQTLRVPAGTATMAAEARRTAPAAAPIASLPGDRYQVRRGDTLSGIARRFELPVTRLAALNDMQPPYAVFTGQTLRVDRGSPAPAAEPRAGGGRVAADARPPARSGEGFLWPVDGKVVGRFGPTGRGQQRDGIDIAARKGAPVVAAENGVVAYAGDGIGSYGRLILLRHRDDYVTTYAHNAALLVQVGDVVRRGQVIARVGDSGDVSRSQLHFELRKGRTPIDPQEHLVRGSTEVASKQ